MTIPYTTTQYKKNNRAYKPSQAQKQMQNYA